MNLYSFVENGGVNSWDYLGKASFAVDGGFGFTGFKDKTKAKNSQDGFLRDKAGGRNNKNVGFGATGRDLLNHMKELNVENCCIRKYRIASHGGTAWGGIASADKGRNGFYLDASSRPYQNPRPSDEDVTIPTSEATDQQLEWAAAQHGMTAEQYNEEIIGDSPLPLHITVPASFDDAETRGPGGADIPDLDRLIKGGSVRFCRHCEIFIYACCIEDAFAIALAQATKCKVTFGIGLTSPPENGNEWKNEIGWSTVGPDGNVTPTGSKRFNPPALTR